MKQVFISIARNENLHHYHFGFRIYKDGKDSNYVGKVSDGILHIKLENNPLSTDHIIFDICLEHPSPFKIPFLNDKTKSR